MAKSPAFQFSTTDGGKIVIHAEPNLKRKKNEFHAELMRKTKASVHVDRKKESSKYAARSKSNW